MNKIMIVLFLLCFSLFAANAQSKFSISPSLGMNLSRTNLSLTDKNSSSLIGYFAGVQPAFQISNHLTASLGIQYATKGYSPDKQDPFNPSAVRYEYIDLLPTLEYKPISFVGVYAGINTGFLLNEQQKVKNKWQQIPVGERTNQFDLGGILGVRGYFKNFWASIHYNQSLQPISEATFFDEAGNQTGTMKQLNKNLQFGVGYQIKI